MLGPGCVTFARSRDPCEGTREPELRPPREPPMLWLLAAGSPASVSTVQVGQSQPWRSPSLAKMAPLRARARATGSRCLGPREPGDGPTCPCDCRSYGVRARSPRLRWGRARRCATPGPLTAEAPCPRTATRRSCGACSASWRRAAPRRAAPPRRGRGPSRPRARDLAHRELGDEHPRIDHATHPGGAQPESTSRASSSSVTPVSSSRLSTTCPSVLEPSEADVLELGQCGHLMVTFRAGSRSLVQALVVVVVVVGTSGWAPPVVRRLTVSLSSASLVGSASSRVGSAAASACAVVCRGR